VLPNATVRRLRVWKHRRTRTRYVERIVEHQYAGRPLRVIIGSPYGDRYDHDWSELAEIAVLREGQLRPGALVFDLGASYGVIAMMLAAAVAPGGRVIALEAHPDDAELARRNGELNGCENLDCLHAAVARASGEIMFGHNGTVDDGAGRWGHIPVPAWSIDDLAERYGMPDVVFIDIEGFEHQALLGATRTLTRRPDWFVEVHSAELGTYAPSSAQDVIDCFDPDIYDLRAGVDRLGLVPGNGVVSRTTFRPLAECEASLLAQRFFLIATPKRR
jgi:FkbM family methyltransferase